MAIAAAKYDRLVRAAYTRHNPAGITEEVTQKDLQEAVDDLNTYIKNGNLKQISFLQYDKELVNQVDQILRDYDESFMNLEHFFDELTATEC